jgi:hypothetical protein
VSIGLKRISSKELSEWQAILTVEAEEAEAARKSSSSTDKSTDAGGAAGARRYIGGRRK